MSTGLATVRPVSQAPFEGADDQPKGDARRAEDLRGGGRGGAGVSRPLDDERYDLILDLRLRLLRVQCKWANRVGDVVTARLYTSRRDATGLVNRRYIAGEFDAFALYCPDVDRCYLLAAEAVVAFRQVHLRLAPCRNNQSLGIRWARDYEFG